MLAKTDETEIIEGCAATPEQEDLRQAVRDWVAANSSSYKAAGRMSGVAESTFTAWLGATYKGNNAKIDEKVRVWLASERNFSRQKIAMPAAAPFVYTKTVGKIMAALEHAQAMPDIAVITGGAGVGKTRSILQYKTLYPNVWHLTARKSLSSVDSDAIRPGIPI
jgi:DNA transposition AAA+ family ATPase